MTVPFSHGGSTDAFARLVSRQLNEPLRKPVLMEIRASGGRAGADHAAKSPPDGYALLAAGIPQALGMTLFENLPHDRAKNLVPIATMATFPSVIPVHPAVSVESA